jgi:hypothetical protein
MLGPMPYSAVQGLIAPGNPPGRHHYWKAGLLGELEDEAIETFVARASDVVSPFTASLMLPFGGMRSRAPRPAPRRSSTATRSGTTTCSGSGPIPRRRSATSTGCATFDQAMADYAEAGVYVNYVADPSAGALEAGFGPDNYARLAAIKREYDPDNVFHNNSNIPPSASGRGRGAPRLPWSPTAHAHGLRGPARGPCRRRRCEARVAVRVQEVAEPGVGDGAHRRPRAGTLSRTGSPATR